MKFFTELNKLLNQELDKRGVVFHSSRLLHNPSWEDSDFAFEISTDGKVYSNWYPENIDQIVKQAKAMSQCKTAEV